MLAEAYQARLPGTPCPILVIIGGTFANTSGLKPINNSEQVRVHRFEAPILLHDNGREQGLHSGQVPSRAIHLECSFQLCSHSLRLLSIHDMLPGQ